MGPPPNSQVAPLPVNLPFRVVSKTIGQGAYAFIRKAVPLNASSPVIAVKFINKDHAFRIGRLKPEKIQQEVTLHKHLGKHTNIIHCLSHGEDRLYTWIAMELADGGDLFDKIEADEGVGEDIAHLYFTQLINAVGYMHSKGVAHRDIKPENMLLSADGNLKLSDFGLAALFNMGGKKRLCNSVCGSPPYIAPEILVGKRDKRADVLKAGYEPNISDIWSCGVVLFVLLVGNTPWDEPTKRSFEFNEYVETNGRPTEDPLWNKIPQSIASLLRGMLKLNPKERWGLEEIRTHPWFTRSNPYLSPFGTTANGVRLATHMIESLHIDFNMIPTASQSSQPRDIDPRELDLYPARFASTQPEAPMPETNFDWERPPRLAIQEGFSASQPVRAPTAAPQPKVSHELMDRLAEDPSLSQFTPAPAVPLSLTQAARRFHDIVPAYSLTRFLSPLTLNLLLPLLAEALHRLGVPVPPIPDSALQGFDDEAYLRVKTVDGRSQGLNGTIAVEKIDRDISEVRFVKVKGDPLEWRRLFKKVVVLCKDGILVPG